MIDPQFRKWQQGRQPPPDYGYPEESFGPSRCWHQTESMIGGILFLILGGLLLADFFSASPENIMQQIYCRLEMIGAFMCFGIAIVCGYISLLCRQASEANDYLERIAVDLKSTSQKEPSFRIPAPRPKPESWKDQKTLRVSCAGSDLGEMTIREVASMLESGTLTENDCFLDGENWRPLTECSYLEFSR